VSIVTLPENAKPNMFINAVNKSIIVHKSKVVLISANKLNISLLATYKTRVAEKKLPTMLYFLYRVMLS
jgi:hypothetical protein